MPAGPAAAPADSCARAAVFRWRLSVMTGYEPPILQLEPVSRDLLSTGADCFIPSLVEQGWTTGPVRLTRRVDPAG